MTFEREAEFICHRYRKHFAATLMPAFSDFRSVAREQTPVAVLGYRRAGCTPLFLEAYLDQPVDCLISAHLGRPVAREAIVEIGNFASTNALAMLELWGSVANDLAGTSEVAVATLTADLRRMFARIGVPVAILAPADASRLDAGHGEWGAYYASDPQVCMGVIAGGQQALAAFHARRTRAAA